MFTVKLPCPPSANSLFTSFHNGRGIERAKTLPYKQWINAAGWALNINRCQPIKGPVSVLIEAPENGRRDLDNHVKPVMDLLVGMSLIQSDRNRCVRRIELAWHGRDSDLHLTVRAI